MEGRGLLVHGRLRVTATAEELTVAVRLSLETQVISDGTNY